MDASSVSVESFADEFEIAIFVPEGEREMPSGFDGSEKKLKWVLGSVCV